MYPYLTRPCLNLCTENGKNSTISAKPAVRDTCKAHRPAYAAHVKKQTVCALVLMVVFALSRWPGVMPSNFSAAYALAFCAGLYFPTVIAWVLPLVTLLITDVLLNALYYSKYPGFSWADFPAGILPNYIGYIAFIGLGQLLRSKRSWAMLMGGSFLGAIIFYVISNTASWLTLPYAKTFLGWIQALTTGLPGYPPTWTFFWKTVLSSGLFSGLFIGSMKAVESMEAKEKEQVEEEEESAGEEAEEPAAS
jgi:hypothetical protein